MPSSSVPVLLHVRRLCCASAAASRHCSTIGFASDQRGMGSEILFRQGDDLTMRDLPDLAATLALYRQLGLSVAACFARLMAACASRWRSARLELVPTFLCE